MISPSILVSPTQPLKSKIGDDVGCVTELGIIVASESANYALSVNK